MKNFTNLLAVLFLLSLFACGNKEEGQLKSLGSLEPLNDFVQSCWPVGCPNPLDDSVPDSCFVGYFNCVPENTWMQGERTWTDYPNPGGNTTAAMDSVVVDYKTNGGGPGGNGGTKSENATATKAGNGSWNAQSTTVSATFTFGFGGSVDFSLGIRLPQMGGGSCSGSVTRNIIGGGGWSFSLFTTPCSDYCRLFPSKCW